ncbi:hypothetical protein [Lactobacillus sp. N54.MGS-719]|nr:hypothetical protein [Lactobacillus sp. N54.MGS-719]
MLKMSNEYYEENYGDVEEGKEVEKQILIKMKLKKLQKILKKEILILIL